jgi:hypothetical protein
MSPTSFQRSVAPAVGRIAPGEVRRCVSIRVSVHAVVDIVVDPTRPLNGDRVTPEWKWLARLDGCCYLISRFGAVRPGFRGES